MENGGENRTGKCPTCGRGFRKRKSSAKRWKPGVGAVRKCDRPDGYTAADVRDALYRCKYAQWNQQEGACGYCNEPMDPKHAVWICARWLDGTGLAKWALGRELVFNQREEDFEAVPKSPTEILEEYDEGLRGHGLWHKRCRRKFAKIAAGIPIRGPAHVREYDNLVARGVSHVQAVIEADHVLREQARERMAHASVHKKSKRRIWLHEEKAEAVKAGNRDAGLDTEPLSNYRARVSPKRRRRKQEDAARGQEHKNTPRGG